jgi:hypothetical protein
MDGHGNLIFCRDCIGKSLKVHPSRLANQRTAAVSASSATKDKERGDRE